MTDSGAAKRPRTKPEMVFREFERELRSFLFLPEQNLCMFDRIEAIIPAEERRRVWRELQLAGFDLPELTLSPRVFAIAAALVLAPVLLLVLSLRKWSMLLSLVELSVLAHRLTRPLAIYPPYGCQTVQQLVLHLSRFMPEDYKAGLWTHEEIAAKVRQIFAERAGVAVQNIKDDTPLVELFGC
jgi:Zn-dependent protease with chaperone function